MTPPSIQLANGQFFDLVGHNVDVLDIDLVAHALANLCRFTGHTRHFYCVTPETRILTKDLRWIPAGQLQTGDWLWGFDESSGGHRDLRKWRPSQAIVHGLIERDLYEIEMEDKTIIRCSAEHPLLASAKAAGNQKWITAQALYDHLINDNAARYRPADSRPMRYLPKFATPCAHDESWSSGWLAGMFDGEGCLTSPASGSAALNIAQNPGEALAKIKNELTSRGFIWTERSASQGAKHRCEQLTIKGGLSEQLRLLSSVRPQRLIKAMEERMDGRDFMRIDDLVPISKIRPMGKGHVVALETTTHTYITEGFGSHNSVAQHSVLASYLVPPEDAKAALLHDAPEILIGDISRPLQRLLPDYRALKATIEAKFFQHFGLPADLPDSVKHADMIMLATEKRDLMPSIAADREHWGALLDLEPMAEHIVPVGPPLAYVLFMRRWREIEGIEAC